MTHVELQMIPVTAIHKSPYQHRKEFTESKLDELARSIERDGLIEPIVVRHNANGYELIAGERRWRATQRTKSTEILARIVHVNDLQARRMCAAENLQRQDLSSVEEVFAITELIDAEMIDDDTYAISAETPVDRVKWLLGKLNSDHRHETNHFANKFISKVDAIFDSLPRPVEWQSFYLNDFNPIIKIEDDVKEIAIKNQLNKSQTKALDTLKKQAPERFEELVSTSDSDGKVVIQPIASGMVSHSDTDETDSDEPLTLRDLSAKEIGAKRWEDQPVEVLKEVPNEILLGDHEGDEWYTPALYIEAARTLMGGIDLDPASCIAAQAVVKADDYFTKEQDGLSQDWCTEDGDPARIWCNPPYSTKGIQSFAEKIIKEAERGNIKEAVILTNNCTDAGWFVDLANRYPLMFSRGRVPFWYPGQKTFATRQGQTFFYIGNRPHVFYTIFSTTCDENGKPIAYMPNWGMTK